MKTVRHARLYDEKRKSGFKPSKSALASEFLRRMQLAVDSGCLEINSEIMTDILMLHAKLTNTLPEFYQLIEKELGSRKLNVYE